MTEPSRGIGVKQGRVLGMLTLMYPRPVEGELLARIADPAGDLTMGARVLSALTTRGLIVKEVTGVFHSTTGEWRFLISQEGLETFGRWFDTRLRQARTGTE